MRDKDLEQKFHELFGLFAEAVREMEGEQREVGSYERREAAINLATAHSWLSAERTPTEPCRDQPVSGIQARATLKRKGIQVADFRLFADRWTWMLMRKEPWAPVEVKSVDTV